MPALPQAPRIPSAHVASRLQDEWKDFTNWWSKQRQHKPESYPTELTYLDWLDAFIAWVNAGRPE